MHATPPSRGSFLDELKRRKVVRVGVVYAAVAWAVTQVADVALSSFAAPPWVMQAVIVLLVLGFAVAVGLAWAFDVTPEGVRRTARPAGATAGAAGSEGREPVAGSMAAGPSSDAEHTRWLSSPSAAAAAVLVAVGAGAGWFAGTSADDAGDDELARSIAVLPFANLAGEDEQYFVDGIHDDILTQLSHLEDLTVISRTTMVRYAGTEKTLPEIAAELGVATVLEGSVQKRGDRVRVTAQLIDASSDAHLWADNFDETLDDYFEIQSRIATEIAGALRATLSPGEEERVARAATDDPAALDRYLRGIVYLGRWWGAGDPELSAEDLLRRAVDNLEAATELDPEYAVAWARLSEAFTELVFLGAGDDVTRRSAREALRRAQELDPELPEAAYSSALYAYHAENRYEDALALLARAQRLAPSDARIHRARGWVVRRLGRYEEAVDAFERSLALDPLGAEGWKVLDSYLHARRYDRLLEISRRLAAEDPQGSAMAATWWEVTVAAVRDGDLTGADRMLAYRPAIFHTSYVDDPRVNAPWSTWLLGLDDAEIASLASRVEDLLPSAEGSPLSLSFALAFRAWALHDVLGYPDARDAALAYERAADGMLATANTPQLAVGILGQRAMNYLRLGEPERAVALADSLARAFPPGLDEWWSSPQARRVRAAVYARVGREGEAIDNPAAARTAAIPLHPRAPPHRPGLGAAAEPSPLGRDRGGRAMSTTPDPSSFLAELKRRKVVRVAIVYAAVAWVAVQIADVALPAFEAPDWVLRVLIALLALGFPVVLALAWAFDVTPDGLRVTPSAAPAAAGSASPDEPSMTGGDGRTSWLSMRSVGAAAVLVVIGASAGWFAGTSADAAGDDALARSIAVLPFANLAGEEEQYFVDGIHDDILTQLSQLEDLTVISRTSMLRYRETDKAIPEIAAELGVGRVLEGSVQKRGDRVRITAQLIDAESDAHLWADSFDETLDDYFAIQSRIATEIASALHATLSSAQEARMATAPTENPEALDRYLRGIVYLGRAFGAGDVDLSGEELLGRAAENLEAAVALDPGYAEAWARLAEAYTELVWTGGGGDEERRRAREALRTAKAIDPDLPAAAYAEALYAYHGEERYEDALDLLARAERLAPSDPRIYRLRGWVVRRLGRFEEAIAAFDESLRLDPLGSEGWQMLDSYLHGRRFDRVIEVARRLGESDASEQSRLATAFWEVAVATQRDGDVGRAERWLADVGSLARIGSLGDPITNPLRTWQVGLDRERLAAAAAAVEALLAGLEASPSTRVVGLGFLAWARSDVLGDGMGRAAAEALERAIAEALRGSPTDQLAVELGTARGVNFLRLGEPDRAVALADSLVASFPVARDAWWSGPQALRTQAAVYARVGRSDEALDIVRGLVPPPSWYTPASLGIDPAFEPLRDHPRWSEVIEAAR